jgi:hypothetical protein
MRKLKPPGLLLLISIVLVSCGVQGPKINLYGPAMYTKDIAYQPKPMSSDSVHHATYASLTYFSGNAGNDKNGNDNITSGRFDIGQGYTLDNFNLSYNAFGEVGGYQNQTNTDQTQPHYFGTKYYQSLGGRVSANAYISTGNVDVRFIGIEMAYSKEFGEYSAYRNALNGQPNYFVNTGTNLFTVGGTSEVIWHMRGSPIQMGLRLFIGKTVGDYSYRNPNELNQLYYPQSQTLSLAYFMQVKNFFFVGEAMAPDGGSLRVGFKF